mmetsp:Transcript_9120/g.31112  ORF Transcript_9120/g.31112 Transcript_9120/m.31112 type:complete len:279 (-) Transcript_9120:127-963(-)
MKWSCISARAPGLDEFTFWNALTSTLLPWYVPRDRPTELGSAWSDSTRYAASSRGGRGAWCPWRAKALSSRRCSTRMMMGCLSSSICASESWGGSRSRCRISPWVCWMSRTAVRSSCSCSLVCSCMSFCAARSWSSCAWSCAMSVRRCSLRRAAVSICTRWCWMPRTWPARSSRTCAVLNFSRSSLAPLRARAYLVRACCGRCSSMSLLASATATSSSIMPRRRLLAALAASSKRPCALLGTVLFSPLLDSPVVAAPDDPEPATVGSSSSPRLNARST